MSAIDKSHHNLTDVILDATNLLVIVLDRQGKIVRFNRACEKTTGYTSDEVLGKDLWETLIPPDQRESVKMVFDQLAFDQMPNEYENHWLTKNGEPRLLAWSNTLLRDEQGQVEYIVGTAIDVTEQREVEAQLHRLSLATQQTSDGVALADLEGNMQFVNPAWAHMHGYEPAELIGQHFSILHTPEQMELEVQQQMTQMMQTGRYEGEIPHKRKDGSIFPTWMTTTMLRDETGKPIGMSGNIRDITAQKEAAAEREKLQEEIIEAQRRSLQELSTPVIPIMDHIIVMPLIGSIDSLRARDITRTLLAGISQHRAKVVILDVTGVAIMDTGVVNHLNKTIQAARLKGARTIVSGISDAVAEAIVDLGIDWSNLETLSDLQTGLVVALGSLGIRLQTANGK